MASLTSFGLCARNNARPMLRAIAYLLPIFIVTSMARAATPGGAADNWSGITPPGAAADAPGIAVGASTQAVAAAVVASLPARRGVWQKLETGEISNSKISVTIVYDPTLSGAEHWAPVDTRAVAEDLLKALVAAGHSPTKEQIAVFVHAQQHVDGVTGTHRVQPLGMAYYNWRDDSLSYDAQ